MERCQPSIVRTRLRFLNGLFSVAVEDGWVQVNPFFELTKRVRGRAKKKEVVLLDQGDKDWTKLPQHHQLLWHLLRWTGSHASEAAGLRWSDIIGVSPKATRDWAATCLREKDINESVIGRLFGHTLKTKTGVYGSVKLETMKRALDKLT